MNDTKRCVVLMGFGIKVDDKTDRSVDLDTTYRIIRSALTETGLGCIRADVHSGVIHIARSSPATRRAGPAMPTLQSCAANGRRRCARGPRSRGAGAPPVHELSNVLMTTHVSGWIDETRGARARLVAENIDRPARDEPPPLNLLPPAG